MSKVVVKQSDLTKLKKHFGDLEVKNKLRIINDICDNYEMEKPVVVSIKENYDFLEIIVKSSFENNSDFFFEYVFEFYDDQKLEVKNLAIKEVNKKKDVIYSRKDIYDTSGEFAFILRSIYYTKKYKNVTVSKFYTRNEKERERVGKNLYRYKYLFTKVDSAGKLVYDVTLDYPGTFYEQVFINKLLNIQDGLSNGDEYDIEKFIIAIFDNCLITRDVKLDVYCPKNKQHIAVKNMKIVDYVIAKKHDDVKYYINYHANSELDKNMFLTYKVVNPENNTDLKDLQEKIGGNNGKSK